MCKSLNARAGRSSYLLVNFGQTTRTGDIMESEYKIATKLFRGLFQGWQGGNLTDCCKGLLLDLHNYIMHLVAGRFSMHSTPTRQFTDHIKDVGTQCVENWLHSDFAHLPLRTTRFR
jgi:hypothetical protein